MNKSFTIDPRNAATIRLENIDGVWHASVFDHRLGAFEHGKDPDAGEAVAFALDCSEIGIAYPDIKSKNARNATVHLQRAVRRLTATINEVL